VNVRVAAGSVTLLNHTQSFGDLTVSAVSAREIPGAQATPHAFITEKRIALTLRRNGSSTMWSTEGAPGTGGSAPVEDALLLAGLLPDTAHSRLLVNPAVHEEIIAVIGR
jgi:hypothetical protein